MSRDIHWHVFAFVKVVILPLGHLRPGHHLSGTIFAHHVAVKKRRTRAGRQVVSPQAQANSVVAFIDRSFGPERVVAFLRTLRTAQSLPQAIETAPPISYAAFEQQWQQWLETRLSE